MTIEDVVCMHSGILVSKKNETAITATWMNLEIIIPSEVSQTEKDKYYIVSLK